MYGKLSFKFTDTNDENYTENLFYVGAADSGTEKSVITKATAAIIDSDCRRLNSTLTTNTFRGAHVEYDIDISEWLSE